MPAPIVKHRVFLGKLAISYGCNRHGSICVPDNDDKIGNPHFDIGAYLDELCDLKKNVRITIEICEDDE